MNITRRKAVHIAALIVSVLAIVTVCGLAGCTERDQVSHNLSQDADNFNVRRRVTVINRLC